MNIAYRCEHCGTMLGAADLQDKPSDDSSWQARCSGCGKKISVPRLLTELPTPQIAEHTLAFPVRFAAGVPRGASSSPNPQSQTQSQSAALAKVMPWAMSLFLHLGVAMILLFIGALVMAKHPDTQIENKGLDPTVFSNMGDDRPVRAGDPDSVYKTGRIKPSGSPEFVRADSLNMVYGDGRPVGSILKGGTQGITGWGDWRGTGNGSGAKGVFQPPPGKKLAAHVVFVIDRSGSMTDSFDALREALANEVTGLKYPQDFHIIMFSGGVPLEMSSRKLVEASASNVSKAGSFLEEVQARGDTDPMPALKRAFEVLAAQSEGTKLIQLLTDGEFPDNQKVLELIDKMNAGRKVHVNTYLYGRHSQAAEKVLEEIAGKNKGQYRYYSSLE